MSRGPGSVPGFAKPRVSTDVTPWKPEERPETLKPYRVVSAAGHIPYHHVRDRQDLAVFRLLDEDRHSPGHQLAVVLYPLRPGNELAIRVVSCNDHRAGRQQRP